MSRTFFLTFMWLARSMMLACIALFAWGLAEGYAFSIASGAICLIINALSAEFYRKRLS